MHTVATGRVTIVVRHVGFAPATIEAPVDTSGPIVVTLRAQAAALAPIMVQAGAYTAGNEHGMTLTSLEVVTTPGATADVARAMQTLPGVQSVDEGTGLFVRGGDVNETKVLLNDAVMLSPYNYETPTGNYTVTVNPFLLAIAVGEIEGLEADDDYVAVHLRGRRFLVYLGMNEFEARLDASRFLRIHRSHIVNLDQVAALVPFDGARLQIEMRDGTKLTASRTRSRELRGLAI